MRDVRTDLAMESALKEQMPGVRIEEEKEGLCSITRVRVESEKAAVRLDKPMGQYITIECPQLAQGNVDAREQTAACLARELNRMIPQRSREQSVLVVGLGNRHVSADALGCRVVDHMMVTRHLIERMPHQVDERLGSVCAIAPGVLGLTGVETVEIVKGVVDRVKPVMVIAIDALAARAASRIGSAVQLADTGISPGSGIGNRRMELDRETLGVPVASLGVPMVVRARCIAEEAIETLLEGLGEELGQEWMDETEAAARKVLSTSAGEMVVTPKEVDHLMENLARTLADGLNMALHPQVELEEIRRFFG